MIPMQNVGENTKKKALIIKEVIRAKDKVVKIFKVLNRLNNKQCMLKRSKEAIS